MKTDIQIAQESTMLHIRDVAGQMGLTEDDLDFYGKYKAKISLDVLRREENTEDAKLMLVNAILLLVTLRVKNSKHIKKANGTNLRLA